MASEIPPEIITDILSRLPAKSLGRFRCVSKNWLAQISEPQFIKRHQNTLNRHHLICDSYITSLCSLPINQPQENPKFLAAVLPLPGSFIFHGSCNGLVLTSADESLYPHSPLVVFNPTTKKFVKLPESKPEMINNLMEIDIMFGFGYDSFTDDYKVVTISYFHYNYLLPPDYMYVHVYSLRNNTWIRAIDSPYDHSHGISLPGVFVNGFLHWIANKVSDCLPVIVAFSLADEKFSEVASPNSGDQVDIVSKHGCKLVAVGEKLGVFWQDELWLMNEYGIRESWSKISINGLSEISMVDLEILYEDGKILLVSGRLMWIYDVEEKSVCEKIDISRNFKGWKVKGSYVESLVSPKFS